MKLDISVTGGTQVRKLLEQYAKADPSKNLDKMGSEICQILAKRTPVRTGETARSWKHTTKKTSNGFEINITNDAHIKEVTGFIWLLEFGHGSRWGKFYPGRFMITKSMTDIQQCISKNIREVLNNHGSR